VNPAFICRSGSRGYKQGLKTPFIWMELMAQLLSPWCLLRAHTGATGHEACRASHHGV